MMGSHIEKRHRKEITQLSCDTSVVSKYAAHRVVDKALYQEAFRAIN